MTCSNAWLLSLDGKPLRGLSSYGTNPSCGSWWVSYIWWAFLTYLKHKYFDEFSGVSRSPVSLLLSRDADSIIPAHLALLHQQFSMGIDCLKCCLPCWDCMLASCFILLLRLPPWWEALFSHDGHLIEVMTKHNPSSLSCAMQYYLMYISLYPVYAW